MPLAFPSLSHSIKKKGELWICALLSPFYFYYSYGANMSWVLSLLLEIPILLLNYIFIRWVRIQVSQRFAREELRPLGEGITSFLLLSFLLLFLVWKGNTSLLIGLWFPFSLWLTLQLSMRRLGPFYVAFLALLLLFLLVVSCFLLSCLRFALNS